MAIKLPHIVIVKAPGLLPMLYKPGELAEELGINRRTLYDWLDKNGAPHTRDKREHIWINGQEFAAWVEAHQKKPLQKLAKDEAYCMHCRKIVQLQKPKIIPIKGKLVNISGQCSVCQGTVVRGGRKDD